MANEIIISDLNPMRFYERITDDPNYHSRPWIDYPYKKTIHDWEQPVSYCRKWQNGDAMRFQFESNFDPIQIDVMNSDGNSAATVVATQKVANKYEPGKYAYEAEISMATIPEDCYILTMNLGGGLLFMDTDPFDVRAAHENTQYWEYFNTRYHGGVLFETGIVFGARLESAFGKLITGSDDVLYNDQRSNPYILNSKAFRSYPIVIGGDDQSAGVPENVDDLQNNIWTCNNVTIDGRSYAKSTDSKAEIKTEDGYPLYGISRIVREGINRTGKIVRVGANPNKKLFVAFPTNTGFFGDVGENGATNIITILSVE